MADPTENDGANGGESIADRAASGEGQTELFPEGVLDGDKRTLANVMRRGLPVELVAKMSTAEIPLRDGLPDPDKLGRLAVTVEPTDARLKYVRELQPDGQRKVVGYKIVANVRPVYTENLGMGEEAVEKSFEQMLGIDAQRAGKVLDVLTERFNKYMRDGERAA